MNKLVTYLSPERIKEIHDSNLLVSLHVHSYYSLLDGMTHPEELVKRTLELGQPAACISDHGVMYSLVDLVNYADKHKQKYIIAMEAYVVQSHIIKSKAESSKENGNGREHLLLVAINEVGYHNLMRLASIAATEGFYYRPRIDDELLKKYNEGLIATSTCLGSRFNQYIMRGDIEGCKRELKKYVKMFNGRFYLEIQPTKEYNQKIVNRMMVKLSQELNIPLVATTDAHYLRREDYRTHDTLLSMQSNNVITNPLRWQFPGDTFFVASRQEMFDMFFEDCEAELDNNLLNRPQIEWIVDPEDTIFDKEIVYWDDKAGDNVTVTKKYIKFKHNLPEEVITMAMDNTIDISDRANVEINFNQTYLPKVEIKKNTEFDAWHKARGNGTLEENYLRYLSIKGLKNRGKTSKEYRDRLEYELGVINGMGFPDYFLLLEDVVSWCRENDIPVGPGRGCFVPGQKVTTLEHGLINIEKVQSGDHVLTHKKVYKPVKGVQSYDIDETIVKVNFLNENGDFNSLSGTEDHEIFAIPKEMGLDFKLAKWMTLGELRKGDILLKPIGKDIPDHFYKESGEKCVHCNGRPVTEEYDNMMRQFHETAMNSTRVLEKTITNLISKVHNVKAEELVEIKEGFEQLRDAFGFDLIIERTFEESAQELKDLGFNIVEVDSVEYVSYRGSVYDLSIEGVSSYTVNGVAVHNSAAGSLVSYAIGLTNVDPIQYGLLFERFLNPTRGKLPDIDTDFCIKNRGRVMNYVIEKHGREHVANIATFGRLQTKAVIKDVAKAMGIPFEEVNGFTKLLPTGPGANFHVSDILGNSDYDFFVKKYPDLFEYASKLEGSPRHVSQHAAGLVVSPPDYPLWSLIPLQKGREVIEGVEAGYLTQLEKGPVESMGLVKYDFLGLKNITELKEQFDMVKEMYDVELNFDNIPMDDKKTWDLIGAGHTLGVFQFASHLGISVLTKIKPQNIEELSAANAFIRPGASGLDEYIIAKKDSKKRRKLHPKLDPILESTYGAIVYQEQIMGLIAELMGIDFGEADIYRRALEKPKKFQAKVDEFNNNVIEIAEKLGFDRKLTEYVRNLIIENSGYGFNKSHAVCYSVVSYWTAYMKANFPLVFYTTLLNGNLDEADAFIAEARQLGIDVLPPHVNHSNLLFSIEDTNIRSGFNAVKGIGPKAVETIVENRPFVTIDDFNDRTDKSANKKVWEALIKFGAFDDLGIEVEDGDIASNLQENVEMKEVEGKQVVFLNRKQLDCWYQKLQEENGKKAPANYLVSPQLLPGKYLDNPEYNLVEEKDGGFVIPEDWLSQFGLNVESVEKTRKKPKGMFVTQKTTSQIPVFRRVFRLFGDDIAAIKVSYMDIYLEESSELGFSFLAHPLEKIANKIHLYEEVPEGGMMQTAGIVEYIEKRTTKTGKPMYWVTIKTPRDKVRITVWGNVMEKYKNIIKKHNLIKVKGIKGFGGISLEDIAEMKLKK